MCLLYFIMPKKGTNHPDNFCYVCSEKTFKSKRRNFTPIINKCYELNMGCKLDDQDKIWVSRICCVTCIKLPAEWVNGSRQMSFVVPMVRRELVRLLLLFNNITGITFKSNTRWNIQIFLLQWDLCHTVKSCMYQSS